MKGNFYENERVALFIDGANLYSAARALGFDIDYRRLLKVFREKGRMVRDPEWYFFTIFGTPSKTGSWGWRVSISSGGVQSGAMTADGGTSPRAVCSRRHR